MDRSIILYLALVAILVGVVGLVVSVRALWFERYYTPPKRHRRSNR